MGQATFPSLESKGPICGKVLLGKNGTVERCFNGIIAFTWISFRIRI